MRLLGILSLLAVAAFARELPDPAVDMDRATAPKKDVAVLAGGCFWGVEAVFEELAGVNKVVSGFAGGQGSPVSYERVSTGTTGHAESVEITYEPAKITYGQLLKIFFSVAHDPTQKNRQGPDTGTQYRSAIFYRNAEQQHIAEAYIKQLTDAKVFSRPIVTEVAPLTKFYAAEGYHQQFVKHNPTYPYVVYNDLPKLAELKHEYPEMLKK
jgi:peptide-methionine (S)-S-oxide reductase